MAKSSKYWKSIKPIKISELKSSSQMNILIEPIIDGKKNPDSLVIIFKKSHLWAQYGEKEKNLKIVQDFFLKTESSNSHESFVELIESYGKTELINENDEHWFMYFPEEWIELYKNESKQIQEQKMGGKKELMIYEKLLDKKNNKKNWGTPEDLEFYLRLHEEKNDIFKHRKS